MVSVYDRSHSHTEADRSQNAKSPQRKDSKNSAATGASAAGVRAISSQLIAFYFRAPIKVFFPARVEYAFARAINPQVQARGGWSWRMSSAGLLAYAVRTHGWAFIPNQILPPLLANTTVGAVLYTSYLQLLGRLYPLSAQSVKRVYPPPPPSRTFVAGSAAGAIQSAIAAPLDALAVRFRPTDILDGRYKNMWQYGYLKIQEIGFRGIVAGWSLSFTRDSLGYGLFFATFEYVKAQSYYAFITRYYGISPCWNLAEGNQVLVIKPHYAIEPVFLMVAGIAASVAQQIIYHPVSLVQDIHYRSLAVSDRQNRPLAPMPRTLRMYMGAYRNTLQQCRSRAIQFGGWRPWLYRHFLLNTIKQVPSTSAGLIIFELVRRRYGNDAGAAAIEKDGYTPAGLSGIQVFRTPRSSIGSTYITLHPSNETELRRLLA
ncbi:MAG: hypothetical protein LQ338_007663 [Usnochroma carphineum]|nr:MAG: hypothetical protein LQ338_007663 [Usnochroma carphineum]